MTGEGHVRASEVHNVLLLYLVLVMRPPCENSLSCILMPSLYFSVYMLYLKERSEKIGEKYVRRGMIGERENISFESYFNCLGETYSKAVAVGKERKTDPRKI